ncbi:ParA family protein [Kitasatospora sp. NPDC085464]|uniref:ParA family protein n=1 Tax=Kitasatospora sp. NPDC085464 TaxID=3364063 RepID=UPI0037CAA4D2
MTDLITSRAVDPRFRPGGRSWPQLWSFLLARGGASKTTTCTSMAVTLALRGYKITVLDLDQQCNASAVLGWHPDLLAPNQPTILDFILGEASFEEVRVQARYRTFVGERREDDEYFDIPNLFVLPASGLLTNADTLLSETKYAHRFNWFKDFLRDEYEGDDDMLFLDNPANYGKLVGTANMMLDENDEVIPSCLASSKAVEGIPALFKELELLRETYGKTKSIPARPTVKRIPLIGVQKGKNKEADNREAVEVMERDYGHLVKPWPYVGYSAVAKRMWSQQAPLPLLAKQAPATEDYRKLATAWGFEDLT